jgi:hypothetical protein
MNKTRKRIKERQLKKQKHKRIIIMIAGGLLLFVSGFFVSKNIWENMADPALIEVSGRPSLEVDKELIDFGDVKLNTNLTFDLRLTNVGDEPLRISEAPYVEVVEGC